LGSGLSFYEFTHEREHLTLPVLQLSDYIYTVEPESEMLIGDPNKGHVSNYYIGQKTTEEEVAAIQKEAERRQLDVLNTRVEKHEDGTFTLHIASTEEKEENAQITLADDKTVQLKVKYGDFKEALQKSVDALNEAKKYAANKHQEGALEMYIKSYALLYDFRDVD
jgi:dipeptidyl-peptidase-3